MRRRSFFSRLAGLVVVPALATFAPEEPAFQSVTFHGQTLQWEPDLSVCWMNTTTGRIEGVPNVADIVRPDDIRIYCSQELLDEFDQMCPNSPS